jgi:hypothetical protein
VKEPVSLSIADFHDTDIFVDPMGGRSEVPDDIGQVIWTSCPGNCDFLPVNGPTTVFMPRYHDFDDAEQIYAEIWDSKTKGLDPPIYATLSMQIKVPSGNIPACFTPEGLPGGLPAPPNNSMGALTTFFVQIQPYNVNFKNLEFREVIDSQDFPWPDMTLYHVPELIGPAFHPDVLGGFYNYFLDQVSTQQSFWRIDHLWDPTIQQYRSAQFNALQKMQFKISDQPETWKTYQITTHPRWFRDTDFKTKVGWQGDANAESSYWQGPYENQPDY